MKRVVVSLAAGIALAEWLSQPLPTWLYLLALPLLLAASFAIYKLGDRWKTLFRCILALLFVVCGMALHQSAQPHSSLSEGRYTMRIQLNDTPQHTTHSLRAKAVVHDVLRDGRWQPTSETIMTYFAPDSAALTLRSGDILEVTTRLRLPADSNFTSTFNYRTYLRRQGIVHTCYIHNNRYQLLEHRPTTLRHLSQNMQQRASTFLLNHHLSPQHRITAAALLLGMRDRRLDYTRSQYTKAGIVHLLCVSGLHVGLLVYFVGLLLQPLGNRRSMRILRATAQLVALWLFVFVSGMAPATLRAGIMFSLFVIARMLQRDQQPFNTLCVAATLSLCVRPMMLFDVGFQYSYAAMAGIIGFCPALQKIVSANDNTTQSSAIAIARSVGKQLWDLLCLTLAAQVAVLPLTLYYFHQFPTYFAITNLLIVPFAGLLLVTALCIILLSFWTWAADIAAWLLNAELGIVDGIVARVAALPYSEISVPYFSPAMVVLAYAALLVAFLWLQSAQKNEKTALPRP